MKWLLLIGLVGALTAPASWPRSKVNLFRKPDHNGLRCFSCHSPDGIEVRAFGFAESDIARRARLHLAENEAKELAHAIYTQSLKGRPLTPDGSRPLQPGGYLLPGKTAAERDEAFGKRLATLTPELTGAPISDMTVALKAKNRLMALDPRKIPVGIPFNRLSEDGFHGPEHATVADWIPDVGITFPDGYQNLADDYLTHPTRQNLLKLDNAIRMMVPTSQIHQLALAKYRSLLLLQHAIRTEGTGAARLDHLQLLGQGNPFWDVAEMAHHASAGDTHMLGIPNDVLQKKRAVPLSEQMRQLRLPWYWIGWTLDPSLRALKRGFNRSGERADYFTQFLWADGPYPNHMAFMLSKKLVAQAYGADLPKGQPRHYEIQFGYLLQNDALLATHRKWESERALVDKIADNAFRLSLFLLMDDLQRTNGCLRPESQKSQMEGMRRFFASIHDGDAQTLCNRAEALLAAARVDER